MRPNVNSPEFKKAISVKRMRDSDAYTIANYTSGIELMYRAAMGVYNAVNWTGKKVAIVCGGGNNGGDGYALAGILLEHGNVPTVYRTSEKLSVEGSYYYEKLEATDVAVYDFSAEHDFKTYDIIVDCILGTGFTGAPRGKAAEAIEKINASDAFVVSVDINSGLDGDSGEAVLAVRSDLTVSIGYYKKGLFLGKAPELIADMTNVDIGIVLV